MHFSPAGAVAWYFCPILNLWKPFQAMQDVWWGSQPPTSDDRPPRGSALVLLWWGLHVAAVVFPLANIFAASRAWGSVAAMLRSHDEFTLAGRGAAIGSSAVAIVLIWLISQRQRRHPAVTMALKGAPVAADEAAVQDAPSAS